MGVFAPRAISRPELAIAGLVGGLLTVFTPWELRMIGGGVWLGLMLAVYFWLFGPSRSVWKGLSITAVSAATLWLAVLATIYNGGVVNVWLIGGSVGAFVLSTTTFYLYGTSRALVWDKILVCTIGGGILGVIGNELGNIPLFEAPPEHPAVPDIMFVVWQVGIALLIGATWPDRDDRADAIDEAGAPPRELRVPLALKVFVALIVAPFAYVIWSVIGRNVEYARMRETGGSIAAYRARRPSLEGLTAPVAQPEGAMTIGRPIDGLEPGASTSAVEPAQRDRPPVAEYSIVYGDARASGTLAPVTVRITQYPTAEWAAYAVRGIGIGHDEPVVKFGQRMLRQANRDKNTAEIDWASGIYVIRMTSARANLDAFIRAYLDRYPSSL